MAAYGGHSGHGDHGYAMLSQPSQHPHNRMGQAPRVGERVRAVRPVVVDGRERVRAGEQGKVSHRDYSVGGGEEIQYLWDSGMATSSDVSVWSEFVERTSQADMMGGGVGGLGSSGSTGSMGSMTGLLGMSRHRLEDGDRVCAIAALDLRVSVGEYGYVLRKVQQRNSYGDTQWHWEFRWDSGATTMALETEWEMSVKKVDLDEIDLIDKTKKPMIGAVFGGIVLQMFVLSLMVWYFWPKFNDDKVQKMVVWCVLPLMSLSPWILTLGLGCGGDKRSTIPGLLMLVAVCMVAGVLTLQHCFILPSGHQLNPVAQVPLQLANSTHMASTNTLICWNPNSGASRFNKFLTQEVTNQAGVKISDGSAMNFGVAFSSVMSPLVPLCLGAVYYFMFIREFDLFWYAPTRSKVVAIDVLDCIVMYDTLFAHDPYFAFEDTVVGTWFMVAFVLILAFWWILVTFQLRYEFQEIPGLGTRSVEQTEEHTWRVLSIGLNMSFFGLRCFLRFKTQYSSPVLMLKNLCIWMPGLWVSKLKRKNDEGSLLEKVHALTAEAHAYRAAMEQVTMFCRKSLEHDRQAWEYKGNYNQSHTHGNYGQSQSPYSEVERIQEGRDKLIGPREVLAPDGQVADRIRAAMKYADEKNDLANRRGSMVSPEELKAKFRSHIESIEAGIKLASQEVNIVFNKLVEKRVNSGGIDDAQKDTVHIGALHESLGNIQKVTYTALEQYQDYDHNRKHHRGHHLP